MAACKIAKIKPTFGALDGKDPLAYIVSANLARRNLTNGQQAMALAFIHPEPERGRGKKDEARKESQSASFSYTRVKQARAVLRHSRELAEAVLKGVTPLNEALDTVKVEEQRASSAEAKLGRLRAEALDLADRVEDEKLTIDEAMAILAQREQKASEIREAGREAVEELPTFCTRVVSIEMAVKAGEKLSIRVTQRSWEPSKAG